MSNIAARTEDAESNALSENVKLALRRERRQRFMKMKSLYVFFLIPATTLFIFHYIPIYGIVIAFKDFSLYSGIIKSPWVGLEHFERFFSGMFFGRLMRNTLIISLLRIVFGFPAPIILAILINEVANVRLRRAIQSISYLPHFMSWVVLAGIIVEILSPQRGVVAYVYALFGRSPPNFLVTPAAFRPILIITGVWQSVGWGTVVYLAALTGIDPELYESAAIDGANRFHMALRITIPSLLPVMTILFILRLGRILNAGFDQILNLYNPLVYEVADIIDTYVYRIGLLEHRYDYGAAVGLFKNVVGITLVLGSNAIIRRFSEYGIW